MPDETDAQEHASSDLEHLPFDNLTLRSVPVDDIPADDPRSRVSREVAGACYSRVHPTPLDAPRLVGLSQPALQLLDLPLEQALSPLFVDYFSGNRLLPGSDPAAHNYCGHQFGHFAGQLGDGAAITLGEVVNARGQRWEVQLKGAGLTPYSRAADGRKVLRSSIREFLASEAMHHLGIPTTRALCCITSDSRVERDILYNGNPIMERCSVVCRLAPTFWRFGTFQICSQTNALTGRAGPSAGRAAELLPPMIDYCIRTHFPSLWAAFKGDSLQGVAAKEDMYVAWLTDVVKRTAALVAGWESVGFTHGVLNTDNMSILGLTIDYGPYGFMDRYNPGYVPNHSDDAGRYDYAKQAEMVRFNIAVLKEALEPIIPKAAMQTLDAEFVQEHQRCYYRIFRNKLGLLEKEKTSDETLIKDLLSLMHSSGADFTITFRALSAVPLTAPSSSDDDSLDRETETVLHRILDTLASPEDLADDVGPSMPPAQLHMLSMLGARDPTMLQMFGITPAQIADEMKKARFAEAMSAMPPTEKAAKDRAAWSAWLRRYRQRLDAEAAAGADAATRRRVMNATNPRVVLRQWIAEWAIKQAEQGHYQAVQAVLAVLQQPFSDAPLEEIIAGAVQLPSSSSGSGEACVTVPPLDGAVPAWGKGLCVSCSS